jgi:histidinol-phosphate/aromatic aminotransferase/cobyric acid decarboxylase-like protein
MTKDHGIAGLRLGYLLAPPEVIGAVRRLQPEWSVSAAAQAAGVAALSDTAHVEAGRAAAAEGKALLLEAFTARGLPVQEGVANFILVETGDATAVRAALLRRGIAVRDCTSFGLPGHIRIAARRPDECRRLVAAWDVVQGEQAG